MGVNQKDRKSSLCDSQLTLVVANHTLCREGMSLLQLDEPVPLEEVKREATQASAAPVLNELMQSEKPTQGKSVSEVSLFRLSMARQSFSN